MLTYEELKALVVYGEDAEGAYFERLVKKGPRGPIGAKLRGFVNSIGYVNIQFNYKTYAFHRVVVFYHTGVWPESVDHTDKDKTNNIYNNLRECTHAENCRNRVSYRDAKGVYPASKGWWRTSIQLNNVYHYIGTFPTKEAAITARAAFKANLLKSERDF